MSVVLGGVWLEGCVWLMGVDGYGVWVVVEYVWLEGMGGHRGVTSWRCGWLREIMRKYILDDVSNATKNTFPVI